METEPLHPDSFTGPRAFGRYMLREGRLPLRPLYDQIMAFRGRILESILFREGCWQVELVVGMPHAGTEMHRHLRCASADLLLNGTVSGTVGGRGVSHPKRGELAAQLRTIGKGEWHGGASGPDGLVYLSFQKWDGEPTFISQDWEPWSNTTS
jgi:hypothetical protein